MATHEELLAAAEYLPDRTGDPNAWQMGLAPSEVAAVLSRLLGRTITYRPLSFDEDRDAMVLAGVPEAIAEMNARAGSLNADGDAAWITDDLRSLLGRPARSFEQFATDYAAAFS